MSRAKVTVEREDVAAIGPGLLVLLGVALGDTEDDAKWLAEKVALLRVFEDDAGKMNRSLVDVAGEALVVSQFTLFADCTRGRRPYFGAAAQPAEAESRIADFARAMRNLVPRVALGQFGSHMAVDLTNDGPVTIALDSRERQ